jgi:hypothetical protein
MNIKNTVRPPFSTTCTAPGSGQMPKADRRRTRGLRVNPATKNALAGNTHAAVASTTLGGARHAVTPFGTYDDPGARAVADAAMCSSTRKQLTACILGGTLVRP